MVPLTALWLPIVVSAVLVFIISALVWTVLHVYDSDWPLLPASDRVVDALRGAGTAPGQYYFPEGLRAGETERSAAAAARTSPSGYVYLNGPQSLNMGRNIALSLVYRLAVTIVIAYLAGTVLGPGEEGKQVFRLVSVATALAYGAALIQPAIWFAHSWRSTWKHLGEAVVYGVVAGAIFVWLWPTV